MTAKWALLGVAFLAMGCGQMAVSPTSPAVGSSTSSANTHLAVRSSALQPVLAQLGRAGNFLDSANHQLATITEPPDPCLLAPTDSCVTNHLNSALDFYQKANGVLDALVPRFEPPDPCDQVFIAAVGGLLQSTSQTGGLLATIAASDMTAALVSQVSHTVTLATGSFACAVR